MARPDAARAEWDRRMSVLDAVRALRVAHEAFGPLFSVLEDHTRLVSDLKSEHGSIERARETLENAQRLDKAFALITQAEEAHYQRFGPPADRAAVSVLQWPAPDVAGLVAKVAIVKEFAIDTEDGLSRPPIEIIEEDFARLIPNGRAS